MKIWMHRAILLGLFFGTAATGWALELVAPLHGTSVDGNSVVVIGREAKTGPSSWRVENGQDTRAGEFKPGKNGVFALTLPLAPGSNTIRIGSRAVKVFSESETVTAPAGMPRFRVHRGDITDCKSCHVRGFELRGGGFPAVCLTCHVVEAQNPAFGGDPTADRHFLNSGSQCGKCHAPHGSTRNGLLRGSSQELCGRCHGTWNGGEEDVHPAYEEGGCAACHDPHVSGYESQLKRPIRPLCRECHEQGGNEALHEPVADADSCGNCHDVHGKSGSMTPVAAPDLCSDCHEHVMEAGHGEDLEDCSACHDPHGDRGMVLSGVGELCMECHDDVAERGMAHYGLGDRCQRCHAPHDEQMIAGAWRVCADCHDPSADRELASLHGNLELPAGTCGTCHRFHGGTGRGLLDGDPHFPLTQGKCEVCHPPNARGTELADVDGSSCRICHPFEQQLEARGARMHDPVAEGECFFCHEPHLGRHPALLRGEQASLCGECHDAGEVEEGRQPHTALETCTDCHHAHGSTTDHLLRADNSSDLCLDCHDDPVRDGEEIHAALDEGCDVCHAPHSGYGPGNLLARPRELCGECHGESEVEEERRAHSVLDDCNDCHRPHGGKYGSFLVTEDADTLCFECHENPAEGEGEVHAALDDGCLVCHSAHAGYGSGNLSAPEREVCLQCHEDPADSETHSEEAARQRCSACHEPHRSSNQNLLRATRNAARRTEGWGPNLLH